MFIAQKLVQSVMYKSIRQCIPRMSDFKYGTSFYFKFLALIDFNLFLNGFPPTNVPLHMLIPIESTIGIVQYILQALIIYYQFLFTVCFLKHACDVLEDNDWPHITKVDDEDFEDSPKRPHYIIAALLFSVICVTMETLPVVQSWYKTLPVYLNILPICVDVILVFFSIMLLLKMDIPVHQNKKLDYITTAFSNLGAVCVFWYISSGIMLSACLKYKVASSNFGWSVAVNFANGLTMLFVILLFTGVTAETMELAQNHKLKNNFLVTATCGGLIAKFVASIVQKFDPMLLHCVSRHLIRQDSLGLHYFFAVGQIFTIIAYTHFSLHFMLMALRLYEKPKIESEYNYIVALTGNGESTTNISVTYPQIEKTKYNT
ncbi:uncharacterized protein LOC124456020 [Xenia sp. Carnegie-2017]|uniref:uncharacterized protein LOC124456020 n=1 Tax=Xenia sp. Carnegie-2017 TaxID=2897299 RepID=UPI001F046541|nr:uncharacterized protein LOC124456020 [Xenia sp. Carnegie-2017]XP_046862520.1 uncharacterized protein LOC124456020 [Xenia sp. Carnegie-2017]